MSIHRQFLSPYISPLAMMLRLVFIALPQQRPVVNEHVFEREGVFVCVCVQQTCGAAR